MFRLISLLFSIYNFMCLFRIIITWIPQLSSSKISFYLAKICDPYLNLFRKIMFLQFGMIDFSPALGLCILSALSTVFSKLAYQKSISIGFLLASIIEILWSFISSIIIFIFIVLLIRLIILFVKGYDYGYGNYSFQQLDKMIMSLSFKISRIVTFKKVVSYKTSLIISCIILLVLTIIIFPLILSLLTGLIKTIM